MSRSPLAMSGETRRLTVAPVPAGCARQLTRTFCRGGKGHFNILTLTIDLASGHHPWRLLPNGWTEPQN